MLSVCTRYARNNSDGEDILQEGFIRVFNNLHQFKDKGSFEGWIRRIMINTAIAYYRAKSPLYAYVDIETETTLQGTENDALNDIGTKELLTMINNLPPGCRTVFNMYAIDGFSHKEIAGELKISEGTSKSQLHDARTILRKMVNRAHSIAKKTG